MRASRLAVVSLVLAVAGCQSTEPRVFSSLEASTDLFALNPADIAVLPVEDATEERTAGDFLAAVREEVARALVQRLYTPLALAKVDEVLVGQAGSASVVDASWLKSMQGKFGEDAALALRITQWDRSSLMSNARLRFSADVTMISAKATNPLWSGSLKGEIKAGGEKPAPRDRAGRIRAAAAEFAAELVRTLPRRHL